MGNSKRILVLVLSLIMLCSFSTNAFADTYFVRYVTRYEVDHYRIDNKPDPVTITKTQTVYGDTTTQLDANVSAAINAMGLEFKSSIGKAKATTKGYSCTITFTRQTTVLTTYKQEVIHKNIYAVYRTNDGIAIESIGDDPSIEENELMQNSSLMENYDLNSDYREFEVLESSTFYRYGRVSKVK